MKRQKEKEKAEAVNKKSKPVVVKGRTADMNVDENVVVETISLRDCCKEGLFAGSNSADHLTKGLNSVFFAIILH